MGIAKTRDGRYLVGQGVTDGNEYKGSLAWRDIVIQLSADGATAESLEKLEFLRDYGLYHSGEGNSVMPPGVSVWISNNGTTTAVEADDITVDGSNYTICGIKWDGSAWDFSQAGQGKGGGSSLPPYTSADLGKGLFIGEAEPVETVVVPEQSFVFGNDDVLLTAQNIGSISDGTPVVFTINGTPHEIDASAEGANWTVSYSAGPTSPTYEIYCMDGGVYANFFDPKTGDYVVGEQTASLTASATPTVQNIIVPEQTVTIVEGDVTLENADATLFTEGAVVLTVNGATMQGEIVDDDGLIANFETDDFLYSIWEDEGDIHIGIYSLPSEQGAPGTYTVSLTKSVPSVEPKWEAAGGGVRYLTPVVSTTTNPDDTYTLSGYSYSDFIADISAGKDVKVILPTSEYGETSIAFEVQYIAYEGMYAVFFCTNTHGYSQEYGFVAASDSDDLVYTPTV